MMLDRRLHAFRPDLADEALKGRVEATRFVKGQPARICVAVANLCPKPAHGCGIDTQLLLGESVRVFERIDGWAWVQAKADGYVGYLPQAVLGDEQAATHRVVVPRTFRYPSAELRLPPVEALSMGSLVSVTGQAETRKTSYVLLEDGSAIIAAHLQPVSETVSQDYVAIAARFLETPYLWGGRSGFGIDCSGLVQLAMAMAGKAAPRDCDMQAASLGREIEREDLQRGDLVFWKGHVGLMEDTQTLLHANGHTMTVARENFADALERIGWLYQYPTGYRRP